MKFKRFVAWTKRHKKPLLIGLGVLIVLLTILWVTGVFGSDKVERNDSQGSTEPEKPVTEASPLTGRQVKPELAKRPVTAIMIENAADEEVRPQSGLKQSGIVFEAIAEGGITRFVVLYQEDQPELIGPVRSLRPYYSDWVLTFDAAVAHVGGSATALAEVQSLGIKDLDQFFNGDSYWRSTDRMAPHNVYTNFANMNALNKAKGFTKSEFTPWPRKEPSPASTVTAKQITIDVSGPYYQVDYTYNKEKNKYTRYLAGEPHVDREKGQLEPDVVIAMKVPNSRNAADGRYDYELVGSGEVIVFQDGTATKGTWSRTERDGDFIFKDSAGQQIKLNPGQTWVTAISPERSVTYTAEPAAPAQ